MLGTLALLWSDSARTKNPIAKMAATQKINRAALDIFILLVLSCAPAYGILCRTAPDALRFSNGNIAQAPATKASRILNSSGKTYQPLQQKGNRPVTSEMCDGSQAIQFDRVNVVSHRAGALILPSLKSRCATPRPNLRCRARCGCWTRPCDWSSSRSRRRCD